MLHRLHIILFVCLFIFPAFASAKCLEDGCCRYSVQIDIDRVGISGVYIMQEQECAILGAIMNEFGVSVLSFTFNPIKGKVRIIGCLPQLNKWHIKRVLKRDLISIIPQLQKWKEDGAFEYYNAKFNIRYLFDKLP